MSIGDTLVAFKALDAELPTSNFATIGLVNNRPVINFVSGSSTTAIFTGFMPRIYTGQGLTIYIYYASTVNTGSTSWSASIENTGIQQKLITTDAFSVTNSSNNNTPATTVGEVTAVAINFAAPSQTDNLAIGDTFRIRITRNGSSDTMAGTAEVISVEIEET